MEIKATSSDERVLAHLRQSGTLGRGRGGAGQTFCSLSRIAVFLSPVGGALITSKIRCVDILRS